MRVVFEIEIDGNDPLECAKTVQSWIKEHGTNWQFYCQDESNGKIYSVDLDEEDEDAVLPVDDYQPLIKN